MPIRKSATRVLEVLAKPAGRLPWRKEFALGLLFIGAPLITGDMEFFAMNLAGLAVAALVARRLMQARSRSQAAQVRQQAQANATRRRTR